MHMGNKLTIEVKCRVRDQWRADISSQERQIVMKGCGPGMGGSSGKEAESMRRDFEN